MMDKVLNSDNALTLLRLMENGGISRKEAAESLGISIKSAGNLASAMISMRIISEYVGKSDNPGRNAGTLIPSGEPVFAVAHIMHDCIVTDYFGYNLKPSLSDVTEIQDHLFLDDIFASYFRKLALRRPSLCGICFVSDGVPGEEGFINSAVPGLNKIPFKSFAEEYIPDTFIILENRYTNAVKSIIGIDIIFSDEYEAPRFYVLNDGVLLKRRNYDSAYCFYHHTNTRSGASALKYARNNDEYVRAVSEMFCNIINLISPDRIYFKSGRYNHTESIITKIYECLSIEFGIPDEVIPDIISDGSEFDLTLPCLRRLIRDKYVESVNFSHFAK